MILKRRSINTIIGLTLKDASTFLFEVSNSGTVITIEMEKAIKELERHHTDWRGKNSLLQVDVLIEDVRTIVLIAGKILGALGFNQNASPTPNLRERTCENCNQLVSVEAKFCPFCGKEIPHDETRHWGSQGSPL